MLILQANLGLPSYVLLGESLHISVFKFPYLSVTWGTDADLPHKTCADLYLNNTIRESVVLCSYHNF